MSCSTKLRTTGALDVAIVSIGSDEAPAGLDVEVITDEAIEAAVCTTDELAGRNRPSADGAVPSTR